MMLFILGSVCVLSAIGYGLILLGRELVSAADQAEKEIIAARAMRDAHPSLVDDHDIEAHFGTLSLNETELRGPSEWGRK